MPRIAKPNLKSVRPTIKKAITTVFGAPKRAIQRARQGKQQNIQNFINERRNTLKGGKF